jgi:lipopolysaccharide biosynthesis glycosyltransferase
MKLEKNNTSSTIIAISADEKYIEYAFTLINQIRLIGNFAGDIILITPKDTSLRTKVRILIHNTTNVFHKEINYKSHHLPISDKSHLTESAFARIFLEDVIPSKYTKCLYLDVDLYINDSIIELLNLKINKTCLAMSYGGIPTLNPFFSKFSNYFNSGVLLINLVKWRKLNVKKKCFELIDIYGSFEYADQDLLNSVLKDSWSELNYKFNYLYPTPSTQAKLNNPVIVHFAGSGKPWARATGGRYGRRWRMLHAQTYPDFNLPLSAYFTEAALVSKERVYKVLINLMTLIFKP